MKNNYIEYDLKDFYMNPNFMHCNLNTLLERAFSIIFECELEEAKKRTPVITKEEISKINKLIESSLKLWRYCWEGEYTEEYAQELVEKEERTEYRRMVAIGSSKWRYDNFKRRKTNEKTVIKEKNFDLKSGKTPKGIWSVPTRIATKERKTFAKAFGGNFEQVWASGIFYLMSFIIEAINDNDAVKTAKLIMDASYLTEIAGYNKEAKRNNNKHKISLKEDDNEEFKVFLEDYKNGLFDNLSYDNKIALIQKRCFIGEKKAKRFYAARQGSV